MQLMLNDRFETMPWEEIDAVVFDVGNVLLTYSPPKLLRDLVPEHEALWPALTERVFHSPYWPMLDRGLICSQEAIAPMAARHPELLEPITILMNNWIDLKDVIEEGVSALRLCREKGKRIYVLSNYNNKAFAHVRQKYDFFNLVDGFLISADVGLIKPDPAIFRRLLSDFSLDASRTLFIDDSPVNIEGALYCGLQALCYSRPGTLDEFMV